jgi:hypothetical protein
MQMALQDMEGRKVSTVCGTESQHLAVYPVQTDGSFPAVLEDYIRMHGAPTKLYSDNARAELSNKTMAILCNFGIAEGSSEPHYQNQNPAEHEIQDVKKDVMMAMNLMNTPYTYWLLCVEYIVLVKNHTARAVLNDRTLAENRTGQTPNVSKLLQFRWWKPVYFLNEDGVAEHVRDELTYVVVTDTKGFAVNRSDLQTATDPNAPNLQAEALAAGARDGGSPEHAGMGSKPVFSLEDAICENDKVYPYAPDELIGKFTSTKTKSMATPSEQSWFEN